MEAERLSLFLASPSGLDEYRRAARECAEQLRRALAIPQGLGFELIGWEDVLPAYGRPQGVINPSLDGCNVLIGILGNRLGTPTGEAESGFVEEFERMAARARDGEDVAILIYTLQLGEDELDDPGEKLQKVIDFRERLSREVFFKEVRSTDHFKATLSLDLVQLIGGIVERRSQPDEDGAAVPTPEGAEQPLGPPTKKGDEDAAAAQLRGLFAEAGKVAPDVPERFRQGRFPLARIALWFTSWQSWLVDTETLGIHELNQVYRARGEAALGSLERRQVLRTICSQPNAAPGWALLDLELGAPLSQLVAFALRDGKDSVQAGAFAVIDGAELDDWLARVDVELDRRLFFERLVDVASDSSEGVRTAMVEFAVRVGGEEARAFLTALAEGEIAPQSVLEGRIRLEAGVDPPAAFALAAEADAELGAATLLAIRGAAGKAARETLELIAAGKTETVRILAAELLGLRGEGAGTLRGLLNDSEDAVALAALSALLAIPDPGIDLAEVGRNLTERKGLRFDSELRLLLARGRPVRDLRDEVSWMDIETAGYYQALAEDHFSEFGEVVRRDLADDFEAFAGDSRERKLQTLPTELRALIESPADDIAVRVADPHTAKVLTDYGNYLGGSEWHGRRFTVAALRGIAANGEPAYVALVRSRLEAEDAEVREAAAAAIAKVGDEEDLARLIELAQGRGGESFARAAVAISPGPAGAAHILLDTSRTVTALLAARHLCAHATELDDEKIEYLLHHRIDDVRRIGVAAVLARAGDDKQALEALLDQYLAAESYFYNVVCLLDRVLYSPPTLQRRTRSELTSFAAEEQPAPLTSSRYEGPLMGLIRSWSR